MPTLPLQCPGNAVVRTWGDVFRIDVIRERGTMLTTQQRDQLLHATLVRSIIDSPEMASTNDAALVRCKSNDPIELPLLVITDRQVQGRGRGDKQWYWESGALTFSLALDNADSLPATSAISMVSGVAVCRACAAVMASDRGRLQPGLKWPNDVLLGGKKLAGILVESVRAPSPRTVVGIGLNLNQSFHEAPASIRAQATSLRQAIDHDVPIFDTLLAVLQELEQSLTTANRDPSWLVEQWRQLSVHEGKMVSLRIGPRVVRGRCDGITTAGALRLATADGITDFVSGSLRLDGQTDSPGE